MGYLTTLVTIKENKKEEEVSDSKCAEFKIKQQIRKFCIQKTCVGWAGRSGSLQT